MQRAISETAKLEREDSVLTATEMLLRQSGHDSMTMQDGRLFDRWIDRFTARQPEFVSFDGFCQDFARYYADDLLFLQLAGFANALLEPQIDRAAYINGKRGMARRVKRLAGSVCQQFSSEPAAAQKLIWGLLTIAGGAAQMTVSPPVTKSSLPDDVVAFVGSANFETVFLNAASLLEANTIPR